MRLSQEITALVNFLGCTVLHTNSSCYFNVILQMNDKHDDTLTLANLMNGEKKITLPVNF